MEKVTYVDWSDAGMKSVYIEWEEILVCVWLIVEDVRAIVLWHRCLFPLNEHKSFLLPVVPSGWRHMLSVYCKSLKRIREVCLSSWRKRLLRELSWIWVFFHLMPHLKVLSQSTRIIPVMCRETFLWGDTPLLLHARLFENHFKCRQLHIKQEGRKRVDG